jgi:hypothetical protein
LAEGEAVTRPLTFAGKMQVLNYRTSRGGSVRVELQDADGKPIRIRFALKDAELFSMRFE